MSKFLKRNQSADDQVEHRVVTFDTRMEVRADGGKMPTLRGYAAVFDKVTELGWMNEKIRAGAFKRSITDGDDVRALLDHDTAVNSVIGRRSANTLRLSEDEYGLLVEIDLPDTAAARDLAVQIDNGNIDGMSFGFRVRKQEWDYEQEPALRTVLDVELIEVSVVTFPAYADTSIAKRCLEAARQQSQAGPDSEEPNQKPMPGLELLRMRAARRQRVNNYEK